MTKPMTLADYAALEMAAARKRGDFNVGPAADRRKAAPVERDRPRPALARMLRAMMEGAETARDIRAQTGSPDSVTRKLARELVRGGYAICRIGADNRNRYALTEAGRELAERMADQ